jgi:glucose-1-phosphate adenylyltransferase
MEQPSGNGRTADLLRTAPRGPQRVAMGEATRQAADVTRRMQRVYALVLAGGRGSRLHQLTDKRCKPALPFAGKLNIIDFALSNCINSGIRRIGVLTQYKAQSLIRHIEHGWGFMQPCLGEFIDVVPAQQQLDASWYSGTADAVWQNLEIVREARPDHVLIVAGDHVYKMDYALMLADHLAAGADVTVACIDMSLNEARRFGVLAADDSGRTLAFEEKPARPHPMPGQPDVALTSMGIYIFGAEFLCEQLALDAADIESHHDFGCDILPRLVRTHHVHAHRFADSCVNMVGQSPYWRDVGTVDAFWEANIDLTRVEPQLNLYDDEWPILSLQRQLPPAKFVFDDESRRGLAVNSLISGGCIVSGATVRRSILFSKVRVGERSVIEDSVVLPNVLIGRNVVVRHAIIDKGCVLPDGMTIGVTPQDDLARFHITPRGITLVTPDMLRPVGHAPLPDSAAMPLQ